VRSALADELTSLEAMEKRDIAGVTLTLGSLAQVVESLPVRARDSETTGEPAPPAADANGASRAWNSVKSAFAGVIDYTPPTDPERPLLTPGSEPLIRSNLALQLQAARLALLRGQQELFRQSLDDAERWLTTYFDTDSAPVKSALDTVRDVRGEYGQAERPDISGSLKLLRKKQVQTEAR
jgi:uroporphyrin-3 C-methyltransferase